ncbi:MAG: sialate O-acetylesterase [Akkermansiaceae bacterium]|jgi:hypothetical protein|nr:sialate O-acetylesterase [Akkermansiaceae bacterium]
MKTPMLPALRRLRIPLVLLALLAPPLHAREWTSADKSKTFEGELESYDPATGKVTVTLPNGKKLSFREDVLSEQDITWLQENAPRAAASSTAASGKKIPKVLPDPDGKEADLTKPVKVFILMGQSNMLGFGKIDGGKPGSLDHACRTGGLYPFLTDEQGAWTVRKDVRNVRVMVGKGGMQVFNNEWMTIAGKAIGPEIGIGHHMGELLDEPVLILKSCIGNRSLGWDLLPPSVKAYEHDGKLQPGYGETPATAGKGPTKPAGEWYAGKQYDDDVANAKKVLEDLETYYPGAKEFEVAGFFWWQGDKDMRNPAHFHTYENHLRELIRCLRKDFDAPGAPFVTASLGQTKEGDKSGHGVILDAMKAVAESDDPDFKGSVGFVYTHPLSKGGSSSSHYNGHAETYMNVGLAMGEAMARLLGAESE